MNLPLVYQTQLHQLAVGFEPTDQLRAQRTAHPLVIEVERPEGVTHPPNNGYADVSNQSDVVPRVGRSEYGTHRMLFLKRNDMPVELVVRIRDDHRRYVPRRFRLDISATVNVDSEQRPLSSRKQSPLMFPGSAYDLGNASTGLRGRVLRGGEPMRWAWVNAYYLINTGTDTNPVFLRRGLTGAWLEEHTKMLEWRIGWRIKASD